jgi:hypothetical protein
MRKNSCWTGWGREHYGDNVHFLDGERLEALNEWATLQSDANARARLLGLRSALQFNIRVLEGYVNPNRNYPKPMYIQGIELYLSEPVNCDDQLLVELFTLWEGFRKIEEIRKLNAPPSRLDKIAKETLWPAVLETAQSALRLVIKIQKKVDTAIEKMKPLGGS